MSLRVDRSAQSRILGQKVAACVLVIASAAIAGAQTTERLSADGNDVRWQPWIGCWSLFEESERKEDTTPRDLSPDRAVEQPSSGAITVCVTPADTTGGVRLLTSIDGETAFEDIIVADGAPHAVEQRGCRGTQHAEWSRSGARLFSRAELACPGDKPHTVSHLALLHGGIWLDILSVTRDGREGVRVRRYRREGDDERGRPAPGPAAVRALTIADVKEISAKLTPLVVQAALVETNARFPLDGRTLIELDKSGVADEVTDLMVALSFPGTFKVDRRRPAGAGRPWVQGYEDADVWGYAPFMYSYWGSLSPFTYPDFVIVDPGGDADGGTPDAGGRVINGRGYTRIEPRRTAGSTGESSGGSTASAADSTSGDSSGGVSSQGYSSGSTGGASGSSSGGDSGRTATPR
jgi:hypothetical protein